MIVFLNILDFYNSGVLQHALPSLVRQSGRLFLVGSLELGAIVGRAQLIGGHRRGATSVCGDVQHVMNDRLVCRWLDLRPHIWGHDRNVLVSCMRSS